MTGSTQSTQGIGKLPYIIDNMFYILNNVQYMPNDPHNKISPSALKKLDGFIKVAHNCGTDVIFKHKNGTSHYFRSRIDMTWQNCMYYLPIYVTSFSLHTKIYPETIQHNNISSAATRSTKHPQRSSRLNNQTGSLPSISPDIIKLPAQTRAKPNYAHKRNIGKLPSVMKSQTTYDSQIVRSQKLLLLDSKSSDIIKDTISESTFLAHLKFGRQCMNTLKHMSRLNIMQNMPKLNTAPLQKWKCPIYAIMKVPCLASNMNTALLNLSPVKCFTLILHL